MNIKHSVIAPAPAHKRSTLRRFLAAAAMSALMLGVASASADDDAGGNGNGTFTVTTIAGVGNGYTGKLDVKGDGKFKVKDIGDKLVFVSHIGVGDLNMKDGRQNHTVGKDSKLGYVREPRARLVIEKSKLTFPEPNQTVSGEVEGRLSFSVRSEEKNEKTGKYDRIKQGPGENVKVKYTVKEEKGKYVIDSASFTFNYMNHMVDKKRVCLLVVCVKPEVVVSINRTEIDVKK